MLDYFINILPCQEAFWWTNQAPQPTPPVDSRLVYGAADYVSEGWAIQNHRE